MKKFLQQQKGVLVLLLALFLGMGTAYAADFSRVYQGQTFYFNITDATNHYVEITYPEADWEDDPWEGYTRPTGNITLPSSVTYNGVTYSVKAIGFAAFYDCNGLTGSLTIPNSVTSIGDHAFTYCSGFTGSLTIGNSVTSIGYAAFGACYGFTGSLTIPNSVTTIDTYAFDECSGFTGSLTLGSSLTSIGEAAFYECSGFTGSLTIPNSVTTIGDYAFIYCSGFNGSLTIGDSVTSIGYAAFGECDGFTGSLTIGDSVTTIGDYAFFNCSGFTGSLIIGNSVTTIGESAFYYCANLSYMIVLPDTPPILGTDAFDGVPTTLPVYVPCESQGVYQNASGWSAFSNIYRISDDCDLLTYSINADGISVTVTGHIDGTAATGLIVIPETKTINGVTYAVTAIGESAFEMCTQLTGSLTIPNSVTTIGNGAFRYCFGFNGSLTIGSSVRNIGSYAFEGCSYFTSMTVLPETPPTLGTDVFSNVPSEIPVYVHCGSLWDYRDASGWSVFSNIQCLLETLTVYDGTATNNRIPAYIFYFDDFTRSQFVIPAADLVEMKGKPISRMTFYTTSTNVPYITESSVDVYLKIVDYTSISNYETKASCTTVYSGFLNIISTESGGEMTIYFDTPFTYNGGNLLVGFENIEDTSYKVIRFYGQTVSGASISGASTSSTGTIPATQQNFIPKTSFGYLPTCEAKSLPYAFGFEEDGEEYCWTMLDCYSTTGLYNSTDAYEGDYCFRFHYTLDPPQYLISPKFEGTTGMNVSFYYKNGSSSWPESFQVGYSTTTQTPDAFIWGEEVTVNNPNNWMLYEDSFPEGTKYVAVKCTSDDQLYLYLDNFSFEPVYCAPEDQCELTFTLTDSYGDGWNGNAIRVVDVASNTVLATMTNVTNDQANAPITETYTLPACNGRMLRFEWVKGTWSYECSYTITNAFGTVILEGTGSNSMNTGDVLGTYVMSCDGLDCWHPFALDATEITSHSATLSWTGYQDSYNVRYRPCIFNFDDSSMGGWTTIDADGDGYGWVLGSNSIGIYYTSYNLTGHGHNSSNDMVVSGSYSQLGGVLTPDNYLVSPQVSLDGIFSFWACAQDNSYAAEHFGVAVSTTSNTDASAFTTIQEWTMTAKSSGAKATPGSTRGGNRDQGTWYQYTVDLSAYAGQMGYVAIRHFNCSDEFLLNVDDIYIQTAAVAQTASADPNAPATIILTAGDVWGDGTGYQMLLDADATAYGTIFGEAGGLTADGVAGSANWGDVAASVYAQFEYKIPVNADGSLSTNNIVLNNSVSIQIPAGIYDWCITNPSPGQRMWIAAQYGNVGGRADNYVFEAGKTYEFTVTQYDANDQVNVTISNGYSFGDWITVENVTNPYTLTGLSPETPYEWEVQGINTDCDDGLTSWSDHAFFTTTEETEVTQTVALSAGTNWFSTNVEITLDDLKDALVAASSGTTITIKSQNSGQTTWNGRLWVGTLRTMDVSQMYMISVANACEITLEGLPIDPTEHPVTISNGPNWIGFPLGATMTITNAFAGFAASGDIVKSDGGGQATWNGRIWTGQLKNLEPGKGYIYQSAATGNKTFTFPTGAK